MLNLHNRLSQNTLLLLISNGGSAALSFLFFIMLGRVLGETQLGIYVTVMAWIFPVSLLAEYGLGTLIVRKVSQDIQHTAAYLKIVVFARIILSGSLFITILVISPLLSLDYSVVMGLQISAPLIFILPLYSTFTAVFRAHQVMKPIAWLNLGMLLIQVCVTFFYLSYEHDIKGIFIINLLTSAGQLYAAWFIYQNHFSISSDHINSTMTLHSLFREATPFALAAVLAALHMRVNFILLDLLSTSGEVGYFAAANRFIEAGRMLPHAFFDALFPLLASLAASPQKLNRLFTRVFWGLLGFGIVFALIFSLLSDTIIQTTYGSTFIPSTKILGILAWGFLPLILRQSHVLFWYAKNEEKKVNRVLLGGVCVQACIGFWLIPHWQATGAAIGFVISEILMLALLFRRTKAK